MIASSQQRHCGMMKCWTYLKPFSQQTGADIEYPASSCVTTQKGWLTELHIGPMQWPAPQLAFRLSSPSGTLLSAAWPRTASSQHFFSAIAFYWRSVESVQIRGLHWFSNVLVSCETICWCWGIGPFSLLHVSSAAALCCSKQIKGRSQAQRLDVRPSRPFGESGMWGRGWIYSWFCTVDLQPYPAEY